MQIKILSRLLGSIPKKPEHLSVSIEKIEEKASYAESILTFSAYFERSVVDFSVKAHTPLDKSPKIAVIRFTDSFEENHKLEDGSRALYLISTEEFLKNGKLTKRARALLYAKKHRGYLPLLSWAAIRVFEYVNSLEDGYDCICVEGNGELKKAALLTSLLEQNIILAENNKPTQKNIKERESKLLELIKENQSLQNS